MLLEEGLVGSIFLDVVLPVLDGLELDNEDVRDAALEIGPAHRQFRPSH